VGFVWKIIFLDVFWFKMRGDFKELIKQYFYCLV